MSVELAPEVGFRQAELLADMMSERTRWLDLRRRVGRTAGLDCELNLDFELCNNYMNTMLEEYFTLGESDGTGH